MNDLRDERHETNLAIERYQIGTMKWRMWYESQTLPLNGIRRTKMTIVLVHAPKRV